MQEDVVEFYRRVVFGKSYSDYRKKFLNWNVNFNECWYKSENSDFIFQNHGYYDQFLNGTA